MAKFYLGNMMLCKGYKDNDEKYNKENSSTYMEDAFFYKLSDGSYYHIEDGPDSELASFISLLPEKTLKESAYIIPLKPRCPFDIYIDEESLHAYLLTNNDGKHIK